MNGFDVCVDWVVFGELEFHISKMTKIKILTYKNHLKSIQTMSYDKEVIFNNIRSMVEEKVNKVISQHLESKNYNVNDAQTWTNQICDEVIL